jgi:RNA polymerase sigma-70 factor, ECF subfamily
MDDADATRDLVERAQRGDRAALDALAQRYFSRLEQWIERGVGSTLRKRMGVEDLVQEAFLKVQGSLASFRWEGEPAFWRWLVTIADHIIQEAGRKVAAEKRSPEKEIPLDRSFDSGDGRPHAMHDFVETSVTSPSRTIARQERFARFQRAIGLLRPEDREVILAVAVNGIPVRDVAKQMGRSPEAISMLLLRAMRKLRATFGDVGSSESLRLPPDAHLGAKPRDAEAGREA